MRLRELNGEIDEAASWNGPARLEVLQAERDALVHELTAAFGLRGRPRRLVSESERARVNVTRAIGTAIRNIGVQAPDLGARLDVATRTGTTCRYDPCHRTASAPPGLSPLKSAGQSSRPARSSGRGIKRGAKCGRLVATNRTVGRGGPRLQPEHPAGSRGAGTAEAAARRTRRGRDVGTRAAPDPGRRAVLPARVRAPHARAAAARPAPTCSRRHGARRCARPARAVGRRRPGRRPSGAFWRS